MIEQRSDGRELPIVGYGHPVLRKKAEEIKADYPGLNQIISDMFATMYASDGVGLAAPQVNLPIRLFIVDGKPLAGDDPQMTNFRRVFINARLLEESGDEWAFEEGCLSIPGIREEVVRKPLITLHFFDEHFKEHTETFSGLAARIIQHEYDHIEGILFIDRLSPFKRRLLKGKLTDIMKGKVEVKYRMKFAGRQPVW
jgi:peptide deformylase